MHVPRRPDGRRVPKTILRRDRATSPTWHSPTLSPIGTSTTAIATATVARTRSRALRNGRVPDKEAVGPQRQFSPVTPGDLATPEFVAALLVDGDDDLAAWTIGQALEERPRAEVYDDVVRGAME